MTRYNEWMSLIVIPFFIILVILLLSKRKDISLESTDDPHVLKYKNDCPHVCIIWDGSDYIRDETINMFHKNNIHIRDVIKLTLPTKNKLYYEMINTTTIPLFSDDDITIIIFSNIDKSNIKNLWNTLNKFFNNKSLFYLSLTKQDSMNDIKILSKISSIFHPLRLEEIINWDNQVRKIIIDK